MVDVKTPQFNRASSKALNNGHLQRVLKRVLPDREAAQRRAREEVTESVWQKLRDQAQSIKSESIEHLDYYLELLQRSVLRNGGHVHFAATSEEANQLVLDIAKQHQVKNVIKTKSMATEETGLAKFLTKRGIDAVETDLGEYILQLADEPPFHMTMPALHKTRQEISTLFQEHLGSGPHTDPKELTAIARKTLRDRFAEADMGVIGANFMVAETGSIVLVTNEGNGRMVTTLPNVLVSVAGIEKVIPALEDLGVFLKLLARSATGQPITSYTTIVSGPRGMMEEDGPQEFHLILLDNGRTKLLEDPELR